MPCSHADVTLSGHTSWIIICPMDGCVLDLIVTLNRGQAWTSRQSTATGRQRSSRTASVPCSNACCFASAVAQEQGLQSMMPICMPRMDHLSALRCSHPATNATCSSGHHHHSLSCLTPEAMQGDRANYPLSRHGSGWDVAPQDPLRGGRPLGPPPWGGGQARLPSQRARWPMVRATKGKPASHAGSQASSPAPFSPQPLAQGWLAWRPPKYGPRLRAGRCCWPHAQIPPTAPHEAWPCTAAWRVRAGTAQPLAHVETKSAGL